MQNSFYKKLLNILLLASLSTASLFADALTLYRESGIENLAKQMDYELSQMKYWSHYLQDKDTSFGYIESYSNILECDKSLSSLRLYTKDENSSFSFTKEYSAYTGKKRGDKIKEGDLKTPVGVYTITKKLEKVDSFYGPMAFVTSYPNSYDKYKGKNGSGIWIHGLPTAKERDKFTKGCIAINNKNIKCLDKHINIDKTILIIKENNKEKKTTKEELATILSSLYGWRYAWIYNKTDDYLNYYDAKFIRFDGMNISDFKRYKTRIFNKKERKKILFNKINVIPYPGNENIYKVTFFERYRSKSFSFSGDKVLILKLTNNTIKIITEK